MQMWLFGLTARCIYAKSLYTIVDGTVYFDRQRDEQMQKEVDAERARLVKLTVKKEAAHQ